MKITKFPPVNNIPDFYMYLTVVTYSRYSSIVITEEWSQGFQSNFVLQQWVTLY